MSFLPVLLLFGLIGFLWQVAPIVLAIVFGVKLSNRNRKVKELEQKIDILLRRGNGVDNKDDSEITTSTKLDGKIDLQEGSVIAAAGAQRQAVTAAQTKVQNRVDHTAESSLMTPQGVLKAVKQPDNSGLNILLCIASFLIVSAAAVLIGMSAPDTVKFGGLWLMVAVFYLAGVLLYSYAPKLKSAAVAFICTALVVMPFTGVAMSMLLHVTPEICWMITSIIGSIMYILAAYYLKNEVISYCSALFIVSLVLSLNSVVGSDIIWYYLTLILLSAVSLWVAQYIGNDAPNYVREPLRRLNYILVPVTVLSLLFVFVAISITDVWMVLFAAAIYYTMATFIYHRRFIGTIVAFLVSIGVLFLIYDLTTQLMPISVAALVFSVLFMAVYVLVRQHYCDDESSQIVTLVASVVFALVAIFECMLYGDLNTVVYAYLPILILMLAIHMIVRRQTYPLGIFALLLILVMISNLLNDFTNIELGYYSGIYALITLAFGVALSLLYRRLNEPMAEKMFSILAIASYLPVLIAISTPIASGFGFMLVLLICAWTNEQYFRYKKISWLTLLVILLTFAIEVFMSVQSKASIDFLVYTHIWAAAFGLLAALHHVRGTKNGSDAFTYLAITALLVPTVLAALPGANSTYEILALIESVLIMIVGQSLRYHGAVVYGAITTGIILMYLMRGYPLFLLLAIAAVIIGFVVWRLQKDDHNKSLKK